MWKVSDLQNLARRQRLNGWGRHWWHLDIWVWRLDPQKRSTIGEKGWGATNKSEDVQITTEGNVTVFFFRYPRHYLSTICSCRLDSDWTVLCWLLETAVGTNFLSAARICRDRLDPVPRQRANLIHCATVLVKKGIPTQPHPPSSPNRTAYRRSRKM